MKIFNSDSKKKIFKLLPPFLLITILTVFMYFWPKNAMDFSVNYTSAFKEFEYKFDNNITEITENLGNYLIDERGGFIVPISENCNVIDKDEYYILYSSDDPNKCFIVLTSSDAIFETSYKTFEGFRGIKERLEYRFNDRTYKTSLFDFIGSLDALTIDEQETLIEYETIYLSSGLEVNAAFINSAVELRALSVGVISTDQVNFDELIAFYKTIIPVESRMNFIKDSIEYNNFKFSELDLRIPNFYTGGKEGNIYYFKTANCSKFPYYKSFILTYIDDSLTEDNEFSVIDNTFTLNKDSYLKILSNNQSRILKVDNLNPQKKISLNEKTYFSGKYALNIYTTTTSEYSTLPSMTYYCNLYSRLMENGKTINVAFIGIPQISYENISDLSIQMLTNKGEINDT